MKTTTFKCICGHIAYYLKRKGWRCTCNNPQKADIDCAELAVTQASKAQHLINTSGG